MPSIFLLSRFSVKKMYCCWYTARHTAQFHTLTPTQYVSFFPRLFNDKPEHMKHATQDKVLTYYLTHRHDEDEHIHTLMCTQHLTQQHTHTHGTGHTHETGSLRAAKKPHPTHPISNTIANLSKFTGTQVI